MAQAIYHRLSKLYSVKVPSRNELDVSNIESVNSYFSDKNFDIVINAAGTLYSSSIIDSDPELWIRDVNVNLIGVYLVSRLAIQSNEDVRIINMSSTAAFNSYSDWTSYCASKAGVLKISMGMVKDGYDIVMMCPGAINTKIRDGLKIDNPNVMTIQEGIEPVINAVNGDYQSGEVIFYRKGTQNIIRQSDVL